jgi:hypothetical protein
MQRTFDNGANWELAGEIPWKGGNSDRNGNPQVLKLTVYEDTARGWPDGLRGRADLSRAVNLGMEVELT